MEDPARWRGRNVLGSALMRAREYLQHAPGGGAAGAGTSMLERANPECQMAASPAAHTLGEDPPPDRALEGEGGPRDEGPTGEPRTEPAGAVGYSVEDDRRIWQWNVDHNRRLGGSWRPETYPGPIMDSSSNMTPRHTGYSPCTSSAASAADSSPRDAGTPPPGSAGLPGGSSPGTEEGGD